jgi:solute carrier family 8 (sodium/calcium exchanger)
MKNEKVPITIVRKEGSDGNISCMIETEPLSQPTGCAREFEDYLPKHDKVSFDHNENEKVVYIDIIPEQSKEKKNATKKVDDGGESSEDDEDLVFKVKITSPCPEEVKISSKNVCFVHIVKSNDENLQDEQAKLLEFYLSQKEDTWGGLFKKAVSLGPQIDQDDLIINDVSMSEALTHFVSITWKVAFAFVPPPNYWKGKAAFIVALTFIGICTAIVGEFAKLLGCELGIDDSITAITIVALGTSLPDTFASMTAAKQSESADSAIGNITGSNSVNVFLGLGLPWVIRSMYF